MENLRSEHLTVEQACQEELHWLTPAAVRKLITRRKIPFRKPGGRLVLVRSELRQWIEQSEGLRLDGIDDLRGEK
jgi:hypothetical protein